MAFVKTKSTDIVIENDLAKIVSDQWHASKSVSMSNLGWTYDGDDLGVFVSSRYGVNVSMVFESTEQADVFVRDVVNLLSKQSVRTNIPDCLESLNLYSTDIISRVQGVVLEMYFAGESLPKHYRVKKRPVGTSPYSAHLLDA